MGTINWGREAFDEVIEKQDKLMPFNGFSPPCTGFIHHKQKEAVIIFKLIMSLYASKNAVSQDKTLVLLIITVRPTLE